MGLFSKKVVVSGTKVTVKQSLPITKILSSVRPPESEKGTKNPPHLQTNISKWFRKVTKNDNQ